MTHELKDRVDQFLQSKFTQEARGCGFLWIVELIKDQQARIGELEAKELMYKAGAEKKNARIEELEKSEETALKLLANMTDIAKARQDTIVTLEGKLKWACLVTANVKIEALEAREKVLVEALEFYADEANYESFFMVPDMTKVEYEGGARAREALQTKLTEE